MLKFALFNPTQAQPLHLSHCLDYLHQVSALLHFLEYVSSRVTNQTAQALTCAGDISLEATEELRSGADQLLIGRTTTGWGNKHQCKDWRMIRQFAKSHRSSPV